MKPEYRRERNQVDAPDIEPPSMQDAEAADGTEAGMQLAKTPACAPCVDMPGDSDAEDDLPADAELPGPSTAEDWQPFPAIEEYRLKWEKERERHVQKTPGGFSRENLVSEPNPLLMQDVPWVPLDKLRSDDVQARLSVCRPLSGLQEAQVIDGAPTHAQNTGEVNFRRRNPMQVASTSACILNRRDGQFLGIKSKAELEAWHECLTWLREDGNNKVLKLYGTNYEKLTSACAVLEESLRTRGVLPEGNKKARIRLQKFSR